MHRDEHVKARDLAIVEKYEATVIYLYPIFQGFPRKHGDLRSHVNGLLMGTVGLLYQAAKSKQLSRLYAVDCQLAELRHWLRFAAREKILSHKQHRVALGHIAETGAMLGAWIRDVKSNGKSGQ